MNLDKFNELIDYNRPKTISISDLEYKENRTLLWGYTCDRSSWHVYLLYGEIYHLCYDIVNQASPSNGIINNDKSNPLDQWHFLINTKATSYNLDQHPLTPNKRLYPEACDYEFCLRLKERGIHLPFTNFNEKRPTKPFYGLTLDHIENKIVFDPYSSINMNTKINRL